MLIRYPAFAPARRFAVALSLTSVSLGRAGLAHADAPDFLRSLPPAPPPLPPSPAREPDEYPRRVWEAFPFAAMSAPFCRGDAMAGTGCGDTAAGTSFGMGALYRVSPHLGLGAEVAWFQFRPGEENAATAYSHCSWMGFLVRGYFLDRGALDPYLETGFGRGTAAAGYVQDTAPIRTDAAGPSVMAGAGIDFWIVPYLRVGPAFSYRWTWLTDVRSCEGSTCETVSLAERGVVGSYASLSLLVTAAFGHEM